MGGMGSGNRYHWWRGNKKTTVEECLSIDTGHLRRKGLLRAGVRHTGGLLWTYPGGEQFNLTYEVDTTSETAPFVRLSYSWLWRGNPEVQRASYSVRLTTTQLASGGLRWWFICPLAKDGRACNRRVAKLHLPPLAHYFGCRYCHDLTYRSALEHDKRVDALRKNPEALRAIMEDPTALGTGQLLLALKAFRV
jgi:hypothetical protein